MTLYISITKIREIILVNTNALTIGSLQSDVTTCYDVTRGQRHR